MKSVIMGAGSYGEVYANYLLESGVEIIGFIDSNQDLKGKYIQGKIVFGNREELYHLKESCGVEAVYCSIGNNHDRVELFEFALSLGFKIPNFIHPTAIVSESIILEDGSYVLAGSIIMPEVKVCKYSMISMGVKIAHHTIIESGSFISTGVNIGANIVLKEKSFVGIGATVMTGVHEIGRNSTIGAGAVVIRNVPDNAVVAGNPAKVLKYKLNTLFLYGASTHSDVVMDILKSRGAEIINYFDDNTNIRIYQNKSVQLFSMDILKNNSLIITIGDNICRKKVVNRLSTDINYGIALDKSAIISDSTKIDSGTVVMQGATIQSNSTVGRHCIVNTMASIDHNCVIEDYVHISPNVCLCGGVTICEGSHIGAGAVIIPGIKVGKWSVIGAGAVVIRDVPDNVLVVGNPAHFVRNINI